jgi:glycopeptide antibiotics resistance protein
MQIFFFRKKLPIRRNLLYTALVVYTALVLGVTLFPIPIRVHANSGSGLQYFFIPFKSILIDLNGDLYYAVRNLLGNIIMFMPLGVLLPLILRKRNFLSVLLISAAATVFIELTQVFIGALVGFHYRQFSVDDIILNLAGAILGYLIYKIIRKLTSNSIERREERQE